MSQTEMTHDVDTAELREVEATVLAAPADARFEALRRATRALKPSTVGAFRIAATLTTAGALDQTLRARETVAVRSISVVLFAALHPEAAVTVLPRLVDAEQALSPAQGPVAARPLYASPGATAVDLIKKLGQLLPWRDVLERAQRGDLVALEGGVGIPDTVAEHVALVRGLIAMRSLGSVVTRPLGYVLHELPTSAETEAVLLELFTAESDRDYSFVQSQSRASMLLLQIGSPAALAALVARVEREVASGKPYSNEEQFLAWKYPIEAIAKASPDLLATAKHYAAPERMARPIARALAQEVLWKTFYAKTRSSADDDAWAEFLVSLWGGPFSQDARTCLLQLPEGVVVPHLRRKLGPPRVAKAVPKSPKWLARYEKGEHEAVWNEMREIGLEAFEMPEVAEVAAATMKRARQEIERIGAVLTKGKYRFDEKKKWHVPPSDKMPAEIAKLEKALKLRVPLSLRAFLEIVGFVDFSEAHGASPYDERAAEAAGPFAGLGGLDPLQVIPPKDMIQQSKPYLLNAPTKGPAELRPVPQLLFGVSPMCKLTGEDPDPMYRFELRFFGADASVLQGPQPVVDFVDYLRITLGAGGFRELGAPTTPRQQRQREALVKGAISF